MRKRVHLHVPDRLGKTLPGNGLGQLAAQLVVPLKDMGLDTVQCQMPGHGHTGRATADDRHPLAGGRQCLPAAPPPAPSGPRPRHRWSSRSSRASSSGYRDSDRSCRKPRPETGCTAAASRRPHRCGPRGSCADGRWSGCGSGNKRYREPPRPDWPRRAFSAEIRRSRPHR